MNASAFGAAWGELPLLPLQILAIAAAARRCAAAARRLGQPAVIGEIAAGILLGPSLFGWLHPAAWARLFPPDSLGILNGLSQLGLFFFMFTVGMEINQEALRRQARAALVISLASVAVPFLLGLGLAPFLYTRHASSQIPFPPFALFLGTALSVTALPVLARILRDLDLQNTRAGLTAVACAAFGDAAAWCALAAVVGIVQEASPARAALSLLLGAAHAAFMLGVLRPWLKRRAAPGPAGALLLAGASALATEMIGIHALFGAFLAGLTMPEDESLRKSLAGRLGTISTLVLLPIFFALTGLRTKFGLLQSFEHWAVAAAIVSVGVAGKLGGGAVAARLTGLPWRDALAVGALMNARGLVELVVLTIGHDLGILSPELFTMLVFMALTTTLMTGPLVRFFLKPR